MSAVKGDGLRKTGRRDFAVNLRSLLRPPRRPPLFRRRQRLPRRYTPVQIAVTGGGDVVDGMVCSGGTSSLRRAPLAGPRVIKQPSRFDYATTRLELRPHFSTTPHPPPNLTFAWDHETYLYFRSSGDRLLSEVRTTFTSYSPTPPGGVLDVAHTTATSTILNTTSGGPPSRSPPPPSSHR